MFICNWASVRSALNGHPTEEALNDLQNVVEAPSVLQNATSNSAGQNAEAVRSERNEKHSRSVNSKNETFGGLQEGMQDTRVWLLNFL